MPSICRHTLTVALLFGTVPMTLAAATETVGVTDIAPNLILFSTSSGNVKMRRSPKSKEALPTMASH